MLTVDSITKGVVIDHISAGRSMEVYHYLKLEKLDCSVAIIKNVKSQKFGRKDIIKIEDRIDIDMNVLGYIDPNITVNIIEDGIRTNKHNLSLPAVLLNVLKCKNPRCITSIEQEIVHEFRLSDAAQKTYRCVYCEQESNKY